MFQKIETAMQAIEQGESLIERLQHLESGALTIAAGDTITSHFLMPYLEKFHETYPNVRIEMSNSYSIRMLNMVKQGEADLAFINLPTMDDGELCIKPCLEIHDIFVSGPDFKAKSSYSRSEIAQLPLILLEKNSSSRRFLDRTFRKNQIELIPQIELAAYDLLIRFASIHLGVACVVKEFSKKALDDGLIKSLNLDKPLPPRSIGCAYMDDDSLSLAAKAFLNLIGIVI